MKLTAEQRSTRDKAFEVFEAAQETLRAEIDAVNLAQQDLFVRLEAAQNTHKKAAEILSDTIHTIGNELTESIGGKSDKWQESDAGTQAVSLAEEYENFEVETFTADDFIEIEVPENDLEQLQADLHDDSSEL